MLSLQYKSSTIEMDNLFGPLNMVVVTMESQHTG